MAKRADSIPTNPDGVLPVPDKPPVIADLITLRHDTAMPLYQQLEEQLLRLIKEGTIPRGETLPAERYLAEALGVSRATVQRCYNTLRERQLIRGQGRHGSIVQDGGSRLLPGMDRLKGFTEEMRELGRKPSTRVVEHQILNDRLIASLFDLPSNAGFLKLVRIRLGNNVPLSHEIAWYSLEAAPFLATADVEGSIYEQLANGGMPLSHCDQTIEATTPSPKECEVFGFDTPLPCLLIKRHAYARSGPMVEYVEGLFRGDAYTYRLRLNV